MTPSCDFFLLWKQRPLQRWNLKLRGQEEPIFPFSLGHYPGEELLFFILLLALEGGGNFMGLHLVFLTPIALGWTSMSTMMYLREPRKSQLAGFVALVDSRLFTKPPSSFPAMLPLAGWLPFPVLLMWWLANEMWAEFYVDNNMKQGWGWTARCGQQDWEINLSLLCSCLCNRI